MKMHGIFRSDSLSIFSSLFCLAAEAKEGNNAIDNSSIHESKIDSTLKDSNTKDRVDEGTTHKCSIEEENEHSRTATSTETPPITSAIISSLSNKHIYEIINPLLPDSFLLSEETKKEVLIASLNDLLDSNKLTPEKFWETALENIPWTLLQGSEYSLMRLKKVHAAESKTRAKKMLSMNTKLLAKKKQNPKTMKEPIVLPPPANPPHYTKAEAVQVLTQYKPVSVIIDKIIALKYVDCGKSQLYRALRVYKEGGELNTPWKKEPKASRKSTREEPEPTLELPEPSLDLPEPSSPPYYTEEQVMNILSNLPAATNPPYYSKAQTANLLLKCGPYEKNMINKLVEQQLVPVSTNMLCHFLKHVKSGEANLAKSWNTKRNSSNIDENKKSKMTQVESKENQTKKRKRNENMSNENTDLVRNKTTEKQRKELAPPKPTLCEVFMAKAKLMDDAEFVRHVTVEMERRGYTLGLKLGVTKSDNEEIRFPQNQQDDKAGSKFLSAQSGGAGATENESRNDGIKLNPSRNNEVESTGGKERNSTVTSEKAPPPADNDTQKAISYPGQLPLNMIFYPSTKLNKNSNIERWNTMYDQLKAFYEEHGHLEVEDKDVNKWVNVQINQWNQMQIEGSQHSMTLYKVQKLNALGFRDKMVLKSTSATIHKGSALTDGQMKREAQKEKLWNERLMELKAFSEAYGT